MKGSMFFFFCEMKMNERNNKEYFDVYIFKSAIVNIRFLATIQQLLFAIFFALSKTLIKVQNPAFPKKKI